MCGTDRQESLCSAGHRHPCFSKTIPVPCSALLCPPRPRQPARPARPTHGRLSLNTAFQPCPYPYLQPGCAHYPPYPRLACPTSLNLNHLPPSNPLIRTRSLRHSVTRSPHRLASCFSSQSVSSSLRPYTHSPDLSPRMLLGSVETA